MFIFVIFLKSKMRVTRDRIYFDVQHGFQSYVN